MKVMSSNSQIVDSINEYEDSLYITLFDDHDIADVYDYFWPNIYWVLGKILFSSIGIPLEDIIKSEKRKDFFINARNI